MIGKVNAIVLGTIALFSVTPFLVHKFWVKKDDLPQPVKEVLQWILDHFISTSLLLLVLSGSLFLYAKDPGNWPKVLAGLLLAVAIVLYQTGNLGFVPNSAVFNQNAQSVHDRAKAAMQTEPWVMWTVAGLFLLASLYLIRKIYLRPEVLGKRFVGGDPDDYGYEEDEEDEERDLEESMGYGVDAATGSPDDVEDTYGGRYRRGGASFGETGVMDHGFPDSESDERAILDTIGGANHSFEDIRGMGE